MRDVLYKSVVKHTVWKDKYHLYNYKLMICQDVLKELNNIKVGKPTEYWFSRADGTCYNQELASLLQYGICLDEVEDGLFDLLNGETIDTVMTIEWINRNEGLSFMDTVYPIKVNAFGDTPSHNFFKVRCMVCFIKVSS